MNDSLKLSNEVRELSSDRCWYADRWVDRYWLGLLGFPFVKDDGAIVPGFEPTEKLKVSLLDDSLSEEEKNSFVNSNWKIILEEVMQYV